MLIGLDCSTSTCGYSFNDNNIIVDAGFLDTKKITLNKDKASYIISFIQSHPNFKQLKKIQLEAALSGFASGFTSQQTLIMLARWNGILEYVLSENLNLPVELVNVNTARKQLFGKCREKGIKPKEYVKMRLEKMYDIHKFDKFKKKGNWDERNSDTYDAIVISLFH